VEIKIKDVEDMQLYMKDPNAKMASTNIRQYNPKTTDLNANFDPTYTKNSQRNRTEDFRCYH